MEVSGRDELARLAGSFNTTLNALERSVEDQRQLVADASHELRNADREPARQHSRRSSRPTGFPREREALRADMVSELEKLTALVADIVELARGTKPGETDDDVRLDQIVEAVAHGPGFARADLAHVFERFYRATDARGVPGSGLGLAIVRQAAESHGGRAEAVNTPGGGALVHVSFGPMRRVQPSGKQVLPS